MRRWTLIRARSEAPPARRTRPPRPTARASSARSASDSARARASRAGSFHASASLNCELLCLDNVGAVDVVPDEARSWEFLRHLHERAPSLAADVGDVDTGRETLIE